MEFICYSSYRLFFSFCMSCVFSFFFFFKQKTAYEMRISDWSSDVCSSDLRANESVDDLERLFASVRLGNDEIVDVDAELASIDRIEGMFGIDESSGTAGGLGCSASVQGDRQSDV